MWAYQGKEEGEKNFPSQMQLLQTWGLEMKSPKPQVAVRVVVQKKDWISEILNLSGEQVWVD